MKLGTFSRSGFTLIELLVVLGIVSLLAALLFPVFVQARAKARQSVCASNLHQIGLAVSLYSQDSDDLLPYGVDPDDKYTDAWKTAEGGKFWPTATQLPLLPDLLSSYISNKDVWHCPSDTGFTSGDVLFYGLHPQGTLYAAYGMSYFYHTIFAFEGQSLDNMTAYGNFPSCTQHGSTEIEIISDATGGWHGEENYYEERYNALMGDGHVATLSEETKQNIDQWQLSQPGCS